MLLVIDSAWSAKADPLLTITCDPPKGFSLDYGSTPSKPNEDGYLRKPTFVIDSDRKKVTVIWAETPDEIHERKTEKELNIPQAPFPAATDARIVSFLKEQISAIEVTPWSITAYSFFPALGTTLISDQGFVHGFKNPSQMATFAHCGFSWTGQH